MKKRSFPPLAAVLFMAAALTAAPFLCGVAPSAAQSDDDGMVDVYDPYEQDSADTPLEEPEPWEADEYTEEWNDETTVEEEVQRPAGVIPEETPDREGTAEDDWTDLYKDIYDDPEGIYEGLDSPPLEDIDSGLEQPVDEAADWESQEQPDDDQLYDDESTDAYDDAVQPYD